MFTYFITTPINNIITLQCLLYYIVMNQHENIEDNVLKSCGGIPPPPLGSPQRKDNILQLLCEIFIFVTNLVSLESQ